MDRRARGLFVAVAVTALAGCNGNGGGAAGSANWPLAQTPVEKFLQTSQPMTTRTKNVAGEYEVLPVGAVKLRVGAPWPGDLEVQVASVVVPKETGQGAPPCTGSCVGYFKVAHIDTSFTLPMWDLVVMIPPSQQSGPRVTIDIRHLSARPGATGTDQRSLPLKIVLALEPAPPPPPPQTAAAHVSLRTNASSEFTPCEKELSWRWQPAGTLGTQGHATAFNMPGNQNFQSYKTAPMKMRDAGQEFYQYYCVYQDSAPNALATGPWTVELHDDQKLLATCNVTLSAGDNRLGFSGGKNYCKLAVGGFWFEYPQ